MEKAKVNATKAKHKKRVSKTWLAAVKSRGTVIVNDPSLFGYGYQQPKKLSKIGEYLMQGKPLLEGYKIVDMNAVLK